MGPSCPASPSLLDLPRTGHPADPSMAERGVVCGCGSQPLFRRRGAMGAGQDRPGTAEDRLVRDGRSSAAGRHPDPAGDAQCVKQVARICEVNRWILPQFTFRRGYCPVTSQGRQSFQGVPGLIIWTLQNETAVSSWNCRRHARGDPSNSFDYRPLSFG